mgnify:CR=1 FL=1
MGAINWLVCWFFLAAAVACPVAGASAGEGGSCASKGLLGSWQCSGEQGSSQLVFQSEDVLVYDGEASSYMLAPGVIRVVEDFMPVDYPYALKGDSLAVTFPDGSRIQCVRVKPGAKPAEEKRAATPPASGGHERFVKGSFCAHSSIATRRYNFDGAGRFSFGAEVADAWNTKDAGGNVTGTLGYYGGNQYEPTKGGTYKVSGDRVVLTWSDGSTEAYRVNMRQNDGRITELQGEGNGLFLATGLCEENLYR